MTCRFWRRLAAAGLLLAALMMLSPLQFGKQLAARPLEAQQLLQVDTVSAASETLSSEEAFDPLTPLVGESDSEGAEDPMPDMRLMREILQIIGDTTDFSRLTSAQREALEELGVGEDTLKQNADLLKSLMQDSNTQQLSADASYRQEWFVTVALAAACILGAALMMWLLRRRAH